MSDDTRQWCYLTSRDAEEAYGPFNSREEAIASARAVPLEGFVVSRCDWADPGDADIIGDEDDLLEAVDEETDEVLRSPEDRTFELKDGANVEELRGLVSDWLRKNLKPVWFCAADAFEDVDCREGAGRTEGGEER